mmetsp:Transcript_46493/g.149365  ORF Transcript_46493/g.149365 Transcript_46493/m.149365 type:complete len:459 (-) Transcript_46493:51-1427(-)
MAVGCSDGAAAPEGTVEVGDGGSSSSSRPPLRVVEFFAGMGGMRCAGTLSGAPVQVVAAYEISEICAEAYRHNFGGADWKLKTIERLKAEELDRLGGDVWVMSPPCQPFTRSGRRQDHEDNRTLALLHLIQVLGEMRTPPRFLLLENVIGFERSESRRRLLTMLASLGWEGAEFALDPESFGLPNRRPRYYGLFRDGAAREASGSEQAALSCCHWRPASELLGPPAQEEGGGADGGADAEDFVPELQGTPWQAGPPPALGDFLQAPEDLTREEAALGYSLEIPQEVMQQRLDKECRDDIHLRSDRTSSCLTKVNGRLPRGFSPLVVVDEAEAGLLEQRPKVSAQGEGPGAATDHIWRPGVRVRYLSPAEQLRLMGYPETYSFPPKLGFKEIAGLVGNSLNVKIVSWLIRVLLAGEGAPPPDLHGPVVDDGAEEGAGGLSRGPAGLVEKGWGPRVPRYS